MKKIALLTFALGLSLAGMTGCRDGRPEPGPEIPRPDQVMSFDKLYAANCAGCHGANGVNGAATALANPEYQAMVDDATLKNIITNGEKGTLMPGFGEPVGGFLTDAQIDALVKGMRAKWSQPNVLAGITPPPYKATHEGDASKGQAVYAQACASCHGVTADKPGPGGSILDGSFLALTNEQSLRTLILAGRPDLKHPDWRNLIPGQPLTDAQISDLTAWMIAQTPATPGHPYPNAQPLSEKPGEAQPIATGKRK